ncbi:hypothetical protein AJ79_02137 [Helicocarpus griseus UAMH5409]|uniref:Uncharacterized protein n=1 Tax=Helicocarpus griseus UAMH5409 TaxID=1447875 RepID=A0A2B7Y403_9EURO|nr:hypothetical protein AJ79_02137 [Helicocarpus griseus UAMH5409]
MKPPTLSLGSSRHLLLICIRSRTRRWRRSMTCRWGRRCCSMILCLCLRRRRGRCGIAIPKRRWRSWG